MGQWVTGSDPRDPFDPRPTDPFPSLSHGLHVGWAQRIDQQVQVQSPRSGTTIKAPETRYKKRPQSAADKRFPNCAAYRLGMYPRNVGRCPRTFISLFRK